MEGQDRSSTPSPQLEQPVGEPIPANSTPKYGSLLPKKNLLHQQQQYFDSADWQMNVMNRKTGDGSGTEARAGDSSNAAIGGHGTNTSRLKPAYMMSPSKTGVARGKSKLSSTSLSE